MTKQEVEDLVLKLNEIEVRKNGGLIGNGLTFNG
jgi:hypothetical protein